MNELTKGMNLIYDFKAGCLGTCGDMVGVEDYRYRDTTEHTLQEYVVGLEARIAELENLLMEVRTRVEKAEARKKRFIYQLTDRAEKAETIAERLANEGSVISYRLEEYSKDDSQYSDWDDAFSDWKRTYEPEEASNA